MMKRTHLLFAVIFSVFLINCAIADTDLPTPAPSTENLNSVAAIVNNEIITQGELQTAIASARQQLAASNNPEAISDKKLRQMVLQQLIDEKLQVELAKRADITVSNAQVTQAIQRIAQGHQITVAQLKEKLQQEGMNYADYRKMIHKQLLMHEVQQNAIGSKVNVTEQDTQNALAEYQSQMKSQQQFHLIDIVAATKEDAEKIITKLKNGADITTVSPDNTKDLGWQTVNTLPEIFLQQLGNMKQDDIAGPIQAPNGFHVIKLVGVQGQAAQPNKMQLQNMAYQMKFQKAAQKWMEEMRKTAYIKINDN